MLHTLRHEYNQYDPSNKSGRTKTIQHITSFSINLLIHLSFKISIETYNCINNIMYVWLRYTDALSRVSVTMMNVWHLKYVVVVPDTEWTGISIAGSDIYTCLEYMDEAPFYLVYRCYGKSCCNLSCRHFNLRFIRKCLGIYK